VATPQFFGRDQELHGTVVNQIDGTAVFPEKLGGSSAAARVPQSRSRLRQSGHAQYETTPDWREIAACAKARRDFVWRPATRMDDREFGNRKPARMG